MYKTDFSNVDFDLSQLSVSSEDIEANVAEKDVKRGVKLPFFDEDEDYDRNEILSFLNLYGFNGDYEKVRENVMFDFYLINKKPYNEIYEIECALFFDDKFMFSLTGYSSNKKGSSFDEINIVDDDNLSSFVNFLNFKYPIEKEKNGSYLPSITGEFNGVEPFVKSIKELENNYIIILDFDKKKAEILSEQNFNDFYKVYVNSNGLEYRKLLKDAIAFKSYLSNNLEIVSKIVNSLNSNWLTDYTFEYLKKIKEKDEMFYKNKYESIKKKCCNKYPK